MIKMINMKEYSEIREAVLRRINAGEDTGIVLREAAEKGDPICQLAYSINMDDPWSEEALLWRRLAEEQGCVYVYTWMYLTVDNYRYPLESRRCFEKAALAGDRYAQWFCAFHQDPECAPKWDGESYAEAMKWYKMLVENNGENDDDLDFLKKLSEKGVVGEVKKIYNFVRLGDSPAVPVRIGELYRDGKGVERNIPEAISWFERVAAKGGEGALLRLAQLYNSEWSGEYRDLDKALEILSRLAQDARWNDDSRLQFEMGLNYMQRGDMRTAYEWWEKSAQSGNRIAQNNMGVRYEHGEGVARDYRRAMVWFLLSAKHNYNTACKNIGVMYEKGLGMESNERKAKKWYIRALRPGKREETLEWLCRVSRLKMNGKSGKTQLKSRLMNIIISKQKTKL